MQLLGYRRMQSIEITNFWSRIQNLNDTNYVLFFCFVYGSIVRVWLELHRMRMQYSDPWCEVVIKIIQSERKFTFFFFLILQCQNLCIYACHLSSSYLPVHGLKNSSDCRGSAGMYTHLKGNGLVWLYKEMQMKYEYLLFTCIIGSVKLLGLVYYGNNWRLAIWLKCCWFCRPC